MARSQYVYLIKAGARRDSILGCYTVKWEMRRDFMKLWRDRQDLLVTRQADGRLSTPVILQAADVIANKRGGEE